MAKEKNVYTCSDCGGTSPKWLGKCPSCGAWNTLIESVAESGAPARNRFASLARSAAVASLCDIEATEMERTPTGHEELDRVLGGGIVEGGVVLIGGDPGIGKSTLLLQALHALQVAGRNTLYVTGEESAAQVALRTSLAGPGVDIVKIPHHGSRFQDPALASWTAGRIAIVSVGEGNRYGLRRPARCRLRAPQGVVRPVFLPEAPERDAWRRRHLLR